MKKNETVNSMKCVLALGLSVFAIGVTGCGGGGGTLTAPATLTVGAGSSLNSISSVNGVRNAISKIATTEKVTIDVYSMDGVKLKTASGQNLPYKLTIDSAINASALKFGSVVIVATSEGDAAKSFKTVVKLSAADLAANGPIQEAGADRVEPADVQSTVIAALLESEVTRAASSFYKSPTPVRFGVAGGGSGGVYVSSFATLSGAIDGAAGGGFGGGVLGDLASSFKSAATGLGVVRDVINAAGGLPTPTTIGLTVQDSIDLFLSAGVGVGPTDVSVRTALSNLKKATSTAAKLVAAGKKNTAKAKVLNTHAASILAVTTAEATAKISAGQTIGNLLDVASKLATLAPTLAASINNLDITNLANVVANAATSVLPNLNPVVTKALEQEGVVDEMAGVIGEVVKSGSAAAVAVAQEKLVEVISNASDVSRNQVLGAAISSTSDSLSGLSAVLNTVAAATVAGSLNIANAIKSSNSNSGEVAAAVINSLSTVDTSLVAKLFTGGEATATSLVADLATGTDKLSGSDLSLAVKNATVTVTFDDIAGISGSSFAKTGNSVAFENDSAEISGSTTYTYTWQINGVDLGSTHAGLSEISTSSERLSFTATAAGTYNVGLKMLVKKAGTADKTYKAQKTLVVAATLSPVISIARKEFAVLQGKTSKVQVSVMDPEGRTLSNSVAMVSGVPSGITATLDSNNVLSVAVAETVAAGVYNGTVTVKTGTTTLATETFSVKVIALADTLVYADGIKNIKVGESLTIYAYASQEKSVTSTDLLSLYVYTGSAKGTAVATAKLVNGFNKISVTKADWSTAVYTVLVEATRGTTVLGSKSYSMNVAPANAPVLSSVKVNGVAVSMLGQTLNYVVDGLNPVVKLKFSVSGTDATTYELSYGGSTLTTGTDGVFGELNLTNDTTLVLMAKNANASFSIHYPVVIEVRTVIPVGTARLEGAIQRTGYNSATSQTNLTTSVVAGVFEIDAAGIGNISLNTQNGDQLVFTVFTGDSGAAGKVADGFSFAVSLKDPNATREATLRASGLTLNKAANASVNGYDLATSDSSLVLFEGKKSDGTAASVEDHTISNFSDIFAPAALKSGITIDVLKLRDAMKEVLVNHAFKDSIDTLTGTNLVLEITVTGPNFKFQEAKTDGVKFNTFRIKNLSVVQ